MPAKPPRILTPKRAWICALINVAATPGLGSLMGRRIVSGGCQLALAIGGFVLLMFWMMNWFYRLMMEQVGEPIPRAVPPWVEKWGTILFVIAWIWAVFTSISLLREAKAWGRSGN